VVDAHATTQARASAATSFDYAKWVQRPLTVFFAGNCVRKRGAAYVRLGLTQLNDAWGDSRVHCTGVGGDGAAGAEWRGWLATAEAYLETMGRNATRHLRPLEAALRGKFALSPIQRSEVAAAMAASKFCLMPRGDTPSSGRIFHAIALGCIPIIVADPWLSMAAPFDGLVDYEDFALFVKEGDAIISPSSTLAARFEALGGTRTREVGNASRRTAAFAAGRWLSIHAPTRKVKSRWVFPSAGTAAAALLEARLAAMRRTHRAALWQHPRNELIANLTLESALRTMLGGAATQGLVHAD